MVNLADGDAKTRLYGFIVLRCVHRRYISLTQAEHALNGLHRLSGDVWVYLHGWPLIF